MGTDRQHYPYNAAGYLLAIADKALLEQIEPACQAVTHPESIPRSLKRLNILYNLRDQLGEFVQAHPHDLLPPYPGWIVTDPTAK